jgi:ABC-type transporter Mla MlaB component
MKINVSNSVKKFKKKRKTNYLHMSIIADCLIYRSELFSDCSTVTNVGLSHIVSLPLLNSLQIKYLNKISDEVFTRMSNLIYMDCSYCSNVRNTGLATLIELSENIKCLNLGNCKNIKYIELIDAAIESIQKRKKKMVLSMNLGHTCINISK